MVGVNGVVGIEWELVPEVLVGGVRVVVGVSDGQDGCRGLPREASAFEGAGGEGEVPCV